MTQTDPETDKRSGDDWVALFAALANPHRVRIIATLVDERLNVSDLARRVGLSRPLVHMHLRKLENAGLVVGRHEVSDAGRAMRFMELTTFTLKVTPQLLADAALSLTDTSVETTSIPDSPSKQKEKQ